MERRTAGRGEPNHQAAGPPIVGRHPYQALINTFRSVFISSRARPVPSATQLSGSSAIETGSPVACLITRSRLVSSAPPPVSTMPLSTMSAASSGAVWSSATLTGSTIAPPGPGTPGEALGDLPLADHDFLWHAVHQIASLDLQDAPFSVLGGASGTDLLLDPLGAALANEQIMITTDVGNDRFVHLVAAHAHRPAIVNAAERQHGHLGRSAPDIDDQ